MGLTLVPPEIKSYCWLTTLKLDNNCLKWIPPELSQLTQLKYLSVADNSIHVIDRVLSKLKGLRILDLHNNSITDWPHWLCTDLINLNELYLQGNASINYIPVTFGNMTFMRKFGFDWLHYILPYTDNSECIIQGKEDLIYLNIIQSLCKKLVQRSESQNLTFKLFYSHLSKLKHNTKSKNYQTSSYILHLACKLGHYLIVKNLLEDGFNPNLLDNDGNTPLILAIQKQHTKCAIELLSNQKIDINLSNKINTIPLLAAIEAKEYNVVDLLVQNKNCDLRILDPCENTILHLLFENFDFQPLTISRICTYLITNFPFLDINRKNLYGLAPIHAAARKKQHSAIRFIIDFSINPPTACTKKFDLKLPGGDNGLTLLHYIAAHMDPESLKLLLESEKIDIFAKDYLGRTARDLVKSNLHGKLLLRWEKQEIKKNKQNFNDCLISSKNPEYSMPHNFNEEICMKKTPVMIFSADIREIIENISDNENSPNNKNDENSIKVPITKQLKPILSHLPKSPDTINNSSICPIYDEAPLGIINNSEIVLYKVRENRSHNQSLSSSFQSGVQNWNSTNRYMKLYKIMLDPLTPNSRKLRILMKIFSENNEDSEEILNMCLMKENEGGLPKCVKEQAAYLLGISGTKKSVKKLTKIVNDIENSETKESTNSLLNLITLEEKAQKPHISDKVLKGNCEMKKIHPSEYIRNCLKTPTPNSPDQYFSVVMSKNKIPVTDFPNSIYISENIKTMRNKQNLVNFK